MAHYVYFPQQILDLQKEIQQHPPLVEIISLNQQYNFEVLLGHVAAYVDMVLDGVYTPPEMLRLSEILIGKLQDKRAGHVIIRSH
jgi:hypothetical protein